ncbi:MAG TPA: EscU/YscU/HrcU family type III secretion system export apparatus switch protein [Thermaerobacter sp.]
MESDRRRAAAALRYRPDRDAAPRVVAAGRGAFAELLVRRAREAGVQVIESPLAGVLAGLPAGKEIPEALYGVVAELLAFAMRLDSRLAGRWQGGQAQGATGGGTAGSEGAP